jgi:hypothetical protein
VAAAAAAAAVLTTTLPAKDRGSAASRCSCGIEQAALLLPAATRRQMEGPARACILLLAVGRIARLVPQIYACIVQHAAFTATIMMRTAWRRAGGRAARYMAQGQCSDRKLPAAAEEHLFICMRRRYWKEQELVYSIQ